eukprot:Protomagalhaensia_sp_Gyna_25__1863@NODE_1988_length_1363_cov_59_104985_g1638_i0_p1_GENE_NODE_1988_length_1363_cov_59_104985_g1638_i0NODE_1988_length_1363_cov_59_104985_g1638_i0_p1_ORF_typecomplete_len192_score8_52zfRING_2/PF13639_6/3_1e12zfC3HC4_2/PF13923_6/1e06zfrbx1/PF12678_7/2_6e06zfRING_11/PF17123_5/2_3e05zfC3HC4/PF00097_25/2_9e05zfC3HC4_3/PF13920_6/0_00053zfANAPC11/PF12861_7/0_00069zfRING_UBOX/PF13445_6/0_0017zfRING_5/PF14634_6/0_0014Ubox/PF04564_15/1_7e03Ubox/PF04564_15/0_0059FANCL_C/PF117
MRAIENRTHELLGELTAPSTNTRITEPHSTRLHHLNATFVHEGSHLPHTNPILPPIIEWPPTIRTPRWLDQLPRWPFNPSDAHQFADCVICCAGFSSGELCRTLPCLHTFHAACIDSWLSRSPTCPCDRKHIPSLLHQQSLLSGEPFSWDPEDEFLEEASEWPPSGTSAASPPQAGWRVARWISRFIGLGG